MELLIRNKIVDHLERNNLLKESQHGFRRRHSCLSNLLSFLDRVTKWIDNGDPVDAVFLDFAKAFDEVPHARLMMKLRAHGISGNVYTWIENWLTERRQSYH